MEENGVLYKSQMAYLEDIVRLGKCYLSEYLYHLEQAGPEKSTKQHLFQDTLLNKEVKNFLADIEADGTFSKAEALEKQIALKADNSIKNGLFLPLVYLCGVFSLNRFERFCITILTAAVRDADFDKVYAFINNDWKRNTLTVEIAVELFWKMKQDHGDYYSSFSRDSKLLRYLCIIQMEKEALLRQAIRLKPRIEAFVLGGESDCCGMDSYIQYYVPGNILEPLLLDEKPYLNMFNFNWHQNREKTTLFYLYGVNGIGKKLNIKNYAEKTDKAVFFLSLDKLDNERTDINFLLSNIVTEVILKQALLCLCSKSEALLEDRKEIALMNTILEFVKKELPIVFLTSDCPSKAQLGTSDINVLSIGMSQKTMEENHRFWLEIAKEYTFDQDVDLHEFANKFTLSPGQIKDIFIEAKTLSEWNGQDCIDRHLLLKVCFEHTQHNLGKKAQKVKVLYGWEELILPDYQKNLLQVACDQIKYKYKVFQEWGYNAKMAYGTGLSLLFSGSPGTGKTMAAQVIANELGLELYKIELASVVSKYIGETERNLNEIFTEAKKSQGIIFFDEADVLFSKRSEVKDSNDKYSNMEAAFMLQKIEEYTGIVILATNYQQNIDEAFKRRIKFLIDFPFPDRSYRKIMWESAFPVKTPVCSDIDFDFLAERFELTGSNIKNIALNAAFLAASKDTKVGMEHIMKAVVNEFTKSGKKLSREELGEYYMYI